ncbi:MAG TPA: ATP-binding protein [Gemmatimonadales bacterium]
MTLADIPARRFISVVAVAFVAAVVAFFAAPADYWTRATTADVALTVSAALAVIGGALAWRRAPVAATRRSWAWVAAGCAVWLVGQLAWNVYELLLRDRPPPYPSLADVGFLGMYLCLGGGVANLLSGEPRRRRDPELTLDLLLVTYTMGAIAYVFVSAGLLGTHAPVAALLTSIGWAGGGLALIWMILREMLERERYPIAAAAPASLGLAIIAAVNIAYAAYALRADFPADSWMDFGWVLGFLLTGAAGALATLPPPATEPPPAQAATAARTIAVIVGLTGMIGLAVSQSLRAQSSPLVATLVAVGGVILAARIGYSIRADRRYAELLEREVTRQTRTLMDSLAAAGAAERNLRLVLEAVPDAVVLLDRDGHMLEFNPSAHHGFPTPPDVSLVRSAYDALEPAAAALVRENLAAAFRGEIRRFEVPYRRDDGTHGITAMLYSPMRDGSTVTRVLALGRDVTDQRRAESQLQQAERLAALGQLVSGVAHEINNPAAIISGFAQTMMLDEMKSDHREMVEMIYDEAGRIGKITQNLLAFARAGTPERALVDVNDVVRRTLALRAYHLTTLNIAVETVLAGDNPRVWANGSQLQQLLLNLLINGEQALLAVEGPRRIVIRTRATETEVLLDVADTGPGVPPAIRAKIFDPFFTTKPEGTGTGLGLSICYGIVRDHRGRIWVDPAPAAGATFHVTLPRDPRAVIREEVPAPAAAPAPRRDGVTALIVDDEEGLRNAAVRFLARCGITAQAVADGKEALALLARGDFDAIVSDVRMPGMGGKELVRELARDRPELLERLILSTGDTLAPETSALLEQTGVPVLVKPFDFDRLEQLIRDVADGRAGRRPTASA